MKRHVRWCFLGLFVLTSMVWAQAQERAGTERAVASLEQQWLQSQKTNNPDLVSPLLADKYVNTSSDGKVSDKAKFLADAKATKYDSVDYENVKVTAFRDTAIAGVPKAVVWHHGVITDLNTVVPEDTSLFLLTAFMINDAGQVVGFGVDLNTSEVHGFLATPLYGNSASKRSRSDEER